MVYSPGDTMYPRAIDYAAKSINYFSTRFPNIPYPYSKHTTFQISEMFGGMEFPMMAANGLVSEPAGFADLTAHEIAHNYFPFLVNTNEERYAWMDEGWVTTFGKSFNNFIGLPEAQFWSFYKTFWNTENDFPLMIPSNNLHFYAIAFYYYEKPWKANVYLFEILKEKGITEPLKAFVERWKYKHPTPYDYFFTMEDILDEDLSWYWKAWYFEFHSPDLKIEKVNQKKNEIEIQITNTGKMPVPVSLKVEFENGEIDEYYKTAYVWKENSTSFIFKIKSENKVKKVILGNKDIIDVNPENNVWNNKVIP